MRSMTAFLALAFPFALSTAGPSDSPRVALKGYDPVAYFTEHKPVKGVEANTFDWDDTRYHFATPKHRDMFAGDPERYAPRFSGNCTGAVLKGTTYEADPEAWTIVDGKLYLFSSAGVKERLTANPAALAKAEEAWRKRKMR